MLQPDDSYEEEMRALAEETAAGITTRNTLSEVETRARADQAAFAEMTAELPIYTYAYYAAYIYICILCSIVCIC